jgi:hypothetical protein
MLDVFACERQPHARILYTFQYVIDILRSWVAVYKFKFSFVAKVNIPMPSHCYFQIHALSFNSQQL